MATTVVMIVEEISQERTSCASLFREAGFEVVTAASAAEALRILDEREIDLVLTDHFLASMSGLELTRRIREHHPRTAVVVMNALATIPVAMAAMRAGASCYLSRPLDPVELERALEMALGPGHCPRRFPLHAEDDPPPIPAAQITGVSECVRQVRRLIHAAAHTGSPVLVHGPSGTGKEVVARSIHDLSSRHAGPFLAVNCGALPEGLAECELFGSEKGSYTGSTAKREGLVRAAEGGTLFLDEIGEMPLPLQVKLLRVLQEQTVRPVGGTREEAVDVRVIAAMNRLPEDLLRAGLLREDLYYRLAVLRIEMMPLARRPEDLFPLCELILERLRTRYGRGPRSLSPIALAALRAHSWPGNVRELENVLDQIFALGEALEEIEIEHLPSSIGRSVASAVSETPISSAVSGMPTLWVAEQTLIRRALLQTGGNKSQAAKLLGISRPYLYRRLKEMDEGPAGHVIGTPETFPEDPPRGS